MRLHELTVTAFGPFAETVRVDFDELGAAGLFLLTGATGSGKTSVLDAVCFGLYGEVPGDRAGARALRSDHAAPDTEPRVVLGVSIRGRSFRFSRSPAWDRPKRRGEGTRRIQAAVVVEEHLDGRWVALTTRLDEAGQLVGGLLGMTCAQFTQVALLPQGRFQTFLRASSSERHAVLQQLFGTRRFDDVERWLVERRQQTRRDAAAGHAPCAAVLDRLCEVGGVDLPEEWEAGTPTGLGLLVDDGTLERWLVDVRLRADHDLKACTEQLRVADQELLEVTRDLGELRAVAARRDTGMLAQQRLAELDIESAAISHAEERLARHRAALPALPMARRVTTAAAEVSRTTALVEVACAAVRLPDVASDVASSAETLDRARAEVERRHTLAESWLPRELELGALRTRSEAAGRAVTELTDRLAAAERSVEQHRRRLLRLTEQQRLLRPGAERIPQLAASLPRLTEGLEAAQRLEIVTAELRVAVEEQQRLTGQAQLLKEEYLSLREQRISGMAAELATSLAVGCSCPVCGSLDHPAPAAGRGGVGRDEEELARAAAESADVVSHAAQQAVNGLRSQQRALHERADDRSLAEWERLAHEAEVALEQAGRDRAALEEVEAQLGELHGQQGEAGGDVARLRAELVAARSAASELEERVGALDGELTALLEGDDGPGSVAALLTQLAQDRVLLTDAAMALREREAASAALAQAEETAKEGLCAAGFESVDDCVAAVLDDSSSTTLRHRTERWHEARREAQHTLRDPEVIAALDTEPVGVAELEAEQVRRHGLRDQRLGGLEASAHRVERVGELHDELARRVATWLPVRRRHATVAALAALVEGTHPDNRLRMRLSGYVLAERLRQVVSAANERLAQMTDQRFALEHSEEKGAGEQRGGLSLRVRDDWSGTTRDPATLSGGESFVVSLALALGLADTVSHEAGGTDIETLFVDEGFGALDADTLDAVMDVLDGLRDGGRVVGLVSHVAELRARVTAQLEVRKTRQGSTLRMALASA